MIHAYGCNPSQLAELFAPSEQARIPSASSCTAGTGRAVRPLADGRHLHDLAAQGLAAWNLEYRRVGAGGGWPATFLDVAAGIDFLAEVDAPLDLSRVVAVGHSAGGQLAFWAAARPHFPNEAPGEHPRVTIRAAVSQAGVLDLALAAGLMPSSTPTRALLGDPKAQYERYVILAARAAAARDPAAGPPR